MKLLTTLAFLFLLSSSIFAQTPREKASALKDLAITTMDAGDTEKAREYLEQAKELDPENPYFDYEIAFSYNIDKDYKKVIKICKKLTKHKYAFPEIYQMMGNAYDYQGSPSKAIKTYEQGMKVFPNSGNLYLERGNMELVQENYDEALKYYIQGTERDPSHASNHYWCAKLYLSTDNEYLGMIYGELFMNLERNSRRTSEISKLLYDTYASEIDFTSDSTFQVSFASNTIYLSADGDVDNAAENLIAQLTRVNFGSAVYEMTLLLSVVGEEEINIASLNRIRRRFRENYYNNDKHLEYPNALFEYQKTVQEAGYLEAYNYWLLSQGNAAEFEEWKTANEDDWNAFIDWFLPNPLELDDSNKFVQP